MTKRSHKMGIFKSKAEKELDSIIQRLEMNMSNNYKDNAQDNLKELEVVVDTMRESGGLKQKALSKYEMFLDSFKFGCTNYKNDKQNKDIAKAMGCTYEIAKDVCCCATIGLSSLKAFI